MNHFLLPGRGPHGQTNRGVGLQYGVNAMELLINALLNRGASRERLVAKVFGGASFLSGQQNIGQSNAEFAIWFLENEKIPCIARDLGGSFGRKLRFWPSSGRAQQMLIGSKVQEIDSSTALNEPPEVKASQPVLSGKLISL